LDSAGVDLCAGRGGCGDLRQQRSEQRQFDAGHNPALADYGRNVGAITLLTGQLQTVWRGGSNLDNRAWLYIVKVLIDRFVGSFSARSAEKLPTIIK
jgi:hypothetical protein